MSEKPYYPWNTRFSTEDGSWEDMEWMYQAFKARLKKELASVDTVQTLYGEGERYPQLIENPASDHLDQ